MHLCRCICIEWSTTNVYIFIYIYKFYSNNFSLIINFSNPLIKNLRWPRNKIFFKINCYQKIDEWVNKKFIWYYLRHLWNYKACLTINYLIKILKIKEIKNTPASVTTSGILVNCKKMENTVSKTKLTVNHIFV